MSTSELDDNGLTRLRREKVGFIFQSFQLLNTLTVLENVELPLLLAGESSTREPRTGATRSWWNSVISARACPISSPADRCSASPSRVPWCMAPELLLADEPTGNLDTATGNVILELLRRIASDKNTAIIMATHSLEAASLADTVVKMRDGKIEEVIAHLTCRCHDCFTG